MNIHEQRHPGVPIERYPDGHCRHCRSVQKASPAWRAAQRRAEV